MKIGFRYVLRAPYIKRHIKIATVYHTKNTTVLLIPRVPIYLTKPILAV
jgi:hypothetical protein